jgi:hypothetical protein
VLAGKSADVRYESDLESGRVDPIRVLGWKNAERRNHPELDNRVEPAADCEGANHSVNFSTSESENNWDGVATGDCETVREGESLTVTVGVSTGDWVTVGKGESLTDAVGVSVTVLIGVAGTVLIGESVTGRVRAGVNGISAKDESIWHNSG